MEHRSKQKPQQVLRFTLPRGCRLYPDTYRKLVAKHAPDGVDYFHDVMNDSGKGFSKPQYRFIGGTGWVGLISESDKGIPPEMVLPMVKALEEPEAQKVIGKQNAGVQTIDTQKSCYMSSDGILYSLRKGVNRKKAVLRGEVSDEEQFRQLIWSMIDDAVKDGLLDILPTEEELGLTLVEDVKPWALETQYGNGGKQVLHNVSGQFTMNLDLQGVWQAGSLTSRGFGLVFKANRKGIFQPW